MILVIVAHPQGRDPMQCPSCGQEIPANTTKCPYCGFNCKRRAHPPEWALSDLIFPRVGFNRRLASMPASQLVGTDPRLRR